MRARGPRAAVRRSGGARATRAGRAAAVRSRSGRTPRWTGIPPRASRGSRRRRSRGRPGSPRARAGRSRRPRLAGGMVPPVERNTLLWALVVFFGASIMFAAIRNATRDEGAGLQLAIQLGAGLVLAGAIFLFVRRRQ